MIIFSVLIWGAETYRWLQKKELSTLGPSGMLFMLFFGYTTVKTAEQNFGQLKHVYLIYFP